MTALENLRVGKSGVIARGIISGVVETDANFLNGGAGGTVQHLILSGYLYQTSDEHPVVRLGERANEILRNGESVHMKLSKEKEPERDKNDRETKKVKILTAQETQTSVRPVDRRLFESLKKLRLNIANEQCVPAFSIFSDSTLTDMCIKLPASNEEFLKVSGVGNFKLEKYGGRFLNAVAEFLDVNGMITETADEQKKSLIHPKLKLRKNPYR